MMGGIALPTDIMLPSVTTTCRSRRGPPGPTQSDPVTWTYSGLHLFDISEAATGTPQLRFHGVLETERNGGATLLPTYAVPNRAVLHGDSVFGIHGDDYVSAFWQDVPGAF
jgi:hypothetical protein